MIDRKKAHPKEKGELVEQIILTEFMKRGVQCSKPIGDNQPFDLIINVKDILYKVQCRTARLSGKTKAAISFNCLSCRVSMTGVYRTDHRDKFDLFAACTLEECETVYIVPSKLATTNVFTAALEHNRLKNVKKAADYTLDRWLEGVV